MGPGTFLTRLSLVKSIFSGAGDKREPALWQWHVAMAMSGAKPPEIQAGWWQSVCWSFCSVCCCAGGTSAFPLGQMCPGGRSRKLLCAGPGSFSGGSVGFGSQLPGDSEGAPQSTPFGLMLSPHISLLQVHFLHEKCCGGGHFRAVMGMQTYGEVVLHHIIHKKNVFSLTSQLILCVLNIRKPQNHMTFCIIETLPIPVAPVWAK